MTSGIVSMSMWVLQSLLAVSGFYAELCSHVPMDRLQTEAAQTLIWAGRSDPPSGLGVCLTQICSITAQTCSNGSNEDAIQDWLSCAESMMATCVEMVKVSPACGRAVVPLSGGHVLCCVLCLCLSVSVLCCSA